MATTRTVTLEELWSDDKEIQNKAFYAMMAATEQPVDWAHEVWDELVQSLRHKDNHRRAIAAHTEMVRLIVRGRNTRKAHGQSCWIEEGGGVSKALFHC